MRSLNNKTFLIVDDHNIIRKGMMTLIKNKFVNATIHSLDSLANIPVLLQQTKVDLLILGMNFPTLNILNSIKDVKVIQPDIKILIFSAYDEDIYAGRYLNVGASGYLDKGSSEEEMINGIRIMLSLGRYVSKNFKNKVVDSYISNKPINPMEMLSNREMEVAKLLVSGQGNLEISTLLNIEKTTVSTYKNRIFEKLEIDNLVLLIEIFRLYSDSN